MKARKTCSPVGGKKVFHRAFLYGRIACRACNRMHEKGKRMHLQLDEKGNSDYPLDMRTDGAVACTRSGWENAFCNMENISLFFQGKTGKGRGREMDLKQLQYFVVSVDCGSFKRAADLLYTTQPHVSKTVKALEEELGCALLDRNIKGVVATETGKNIYNYARQVLIDSNRIINLPEELTQRTLKVAANSGDRMVALFSHYYMEKSRVEKQLKADYVKGSMEQILGSVSGGETDVGFVFVSHRQQAFFSRMLEQKKLCFQALHSMEPLLFVGPGNPLYRRTSVTDGELRNYRFIQSPEDDYAINMNPGYMQAEYPFYKNQQVITTNSEHLLIHMLLETDLCNISYNLPSDVCVNEKIRAIPIEGKDSDVTFGYVVRREEEIPSQVQDFIQYVSRQISQGEGDFSEK